MAQPMIILTGPDDVERLCLALELVKNEPVQGMFAAWARAGELMDDLRAVAVAWDWEAYSAGNTEVWP